MTSLVVCSMVSITVGTLCLLLLICTGCEPVISSASETGGCILFTFKEIVSKLLAFVALQDSWKRLVFHDLEMLTVDGKASGNEVVLFNS